MYLCMLCCVSCLPSPYTPIHKGFHNSGVGVEGARPTVVWAEGRRPPPLWMGVWGLGRQLTQQSMHKYMQIYVKCVYEYIPRWI